MIYRGKSGGNYGWSLTEGGRQEVRPDRVKGPTPVLPPLVAHSHEEAASITGGEFYHGKRLPELEGAYLYGDYQMGTFWMLRTQGDAVVEHRELCRTSLMPAGFGMDAQDELIICDHSGGGLWRLARNPQAGRVSDFPRRLSQTGLFKDVVREEPSPGVLEYEIHSPRWADHAKSRRWVGLPDVSGVSVAKQSKGVVLTGRWAFPEGSVLAKTYSMEMERGNPASARKLETQVLYYDGNLWGAYSYKWNAEQTDAELVAAAGEELALNIVDKTAPGGKTEQRWRIFSRSECARCHTMWTEFTPGFSALQLDRPTAEAPGRQLDLLTKLGLTPEDPKLTDPFGQSGSAEVKARSYLHSNCSTCHRYNGGGSVPAYLNIEVPLKEAKIMDVAPVQGDLGLPDARVIARGDPARSVLLFRMATGGRGHMPYLGGRLVDERALLVVRDWIAGLKSVSWAVSAEARKQREEEEQALGRLKAGDGTKLDLLLGSNSGALSVLLAIVDGSLGGALREQAILRGSASADPLRSGLFERYLPESQRRQVLGAAPDVARILAHAGDAARGERVFASVCAACHRANGAGIGFGPDLSRVGQKWDRAGLLEQILQPGKVLEPQWHPTTVEVQGGQTKMGFVSARDTQALTLTQPGGVVEKIPLGTILKSSSSRVSLMPEGLLQALTLGEAADLLEYLGTLR